MPQRDGTVPESIQYLPHSYTDVVLPESMICYVIIRNNYGSTTLSRGVSLSTFKMLLYQNQTKPNNNKYKNPNNQS